MASGGSSPFFEDGNYEWRGDARTQLPSNFKTTQKVLSLPFFKRGYFEPLAGDNGRSKKEEEKRMILTRNDPFDFDGDLKSNENEVRERMN